MSSLSDARRFTNTSRVEQRIRDARQDNYRSVQPGEFVEGGQWASELRGNPFFSESTKHILAKEFYRLIQDESDASLLTHMFTVEKATENRETVIKLLENRIRTLQKQTVSSAA